MTREKTPIDEVRRYYSQKVQQRGATPQGVDWREADSQGVRFHQLTLLIGDDESASLTDADCRSGALGFILRARGCCEGVDVFGPMIEPARRHLEQDSDCELSIGQLPILQADFVVASGIFNVKGAKSRTDGGSIS